MQNAGVVLLLPPSQGEKVPSQNEKPVLPMRRANRRSPAGVDPVIAISSCRERVILDDLS